VDPILVPRLAELSLFLVHLLALKGLTAKHQPNEHSKSVKDEWRALDLRTRDLILYHGRIRFRGAER
jgi:hypothetical protein